MLKKVYKPVRGRPLRIVMMSNGPEIPTGYGKVLREIAIRLSKDDRFEVHIINENNINGKTYNFQGIPVHCPQLEKPEMHRLHEGVFRILEEIKPDVFWVLEDSFTLSNFGIPNLSHYPVRKIFYVPLDGGNIPDIGVASIRSMDDIVAMSKFTQKNLEREGFNSEMIWHGVDLEQFSPVSETHQKALKKKFGFGEDDFIVFNYGRNSNIRKNNQGLLKVAAAYLKNAPKNHKFLIHTLQAEQPGNDLIDYKERILSIDYDKTVLDRIIFTPFTDQKFAPDGIVAELMQMSDLVITVSIGEGFGLIMAEAMACGKPIISNAYTTPQELLEEPVGDLGPRGWIVPNTTPFVAHMNTEHAYADYDRFVNTMNKVVANPLEMKARGVRGRIFAERYLNWDYLTEEWKKILLKYD